PTGGMAPSDAAQWSPSTPRAAPSSPAASPAATAAPWGGNVMSIPHPIPYQGSKRGLARAILQYFPDDTVRLVEPFAGSAAVSIAAAHYGIAQKFVLNDLNRALIALWDEIINQPERIARAYETLWREQA